MRIISQDGRFDIPYEQAYLEWKSAYTTDKNNELNMSYIIYATIGDNTIKLAEYEEKENCERVFKGIGEIYKERDVACLYLYGEDELEMDNESGG